MKYMKILAGPDTSKNVVHNIYPDGMPMPQAMMDPQIGGYRKCRHIYEYVGSDICPDCGKPTHEANRFLQGEAHKKYIADGYRDRFQCDICGGTIRVWWDI